MEKLLIIRLGSIGDVLHCLGIPEAFKIKFPNAEVHWLVKQEFGFLVEHHPKVAQTITFDREMGFWGLFKLAWSLRKEHYTHVYDAHNNLRSNFVLNVLMFFRKPEILQRPKNRWRRFKYFKLKKRTEYRMPYYSQYSYLRPLAHWLGKTYIPPAPQLFFPDATLDFAMRKIRVPQPFIALVPSAAWTMKRWPQEYWKKLIDALPTASFVILGGPQDHFCEKYEQLEPHRVQNLAGKLTLIESCAVIKAASLTVSGDTGLLHAADQLGVPAIALIGPTAFGYPQRETSHIMEVKDLPCKPCSKDGSGKCSQATFRKCLVDLTPEMVATKVVEVLGAQTPK
jgi:ADP-heptose:LPS heptosyltransferase